MGVDVWLSRRRDIIAQASERLVRARSGWHKRLKDG